MTSNEIVVNTNLGGRSTYQNAGDTRRRGAELALGYRFAEAFRLQLAYTYVDATYRDAYTTCVAAPCATPTVVVNAGNRLPGVPRSNVYANLTWGHELGWHAGVNGQYVTAVPVNDLNTTFTPGYGLLGLNGGYGMELRTMQLSAFVRMNNVTNRRYVGSIIVNDGNGRFFEPGPGFNWLAGVNVSVK